MKVGSCGKNERSTYIYVYNSKIERRTLNENEKKNKWKPNGNKYNDRVNHFYFTQLVRNELYCEQG